uniref:MATA-HMG n=1 Tax=Rhizophagus irregularis TaxID=588596 RepID=A0A1B1ETW6_9GLOM|nr:MATA-HMG [Rhizophagus irregularis]
MRNLYQQLLMFLECYLILMYVSLIHSSMWCSRKAASSNARTKIKKPPRPPNAFILYRRAKQPGIVASHQGITNNEVS